MPYQRPEPKSKEEADEGVSSQQGAPRILVVSFVFPHPLNSGGARDIYQRLRALKAGGYEIDLIATSRYEVDQADIDAISNLVERTWIVNRRRDVACLLSLKPFHYKTRCALKEIQLERQYFALIAESEFVGAIFENRTLDARHRILRVHNDERHLHKVLSRDESSIRDKFLLFAESMKFARYTPQLFRRCDQLWFISKDELERFSKTSDSITAEAHHVPMIVDIESIKQLPLQTSLVFYVGALSVPINQNGLIWYLENVHPLLLSLPDYELVLAGQRGSASIDPLLRAIQRSERVSIHYNLPNVDDWYGRAGAFINPVQRGAGVKIKTLDAAAAGLPIVTTTAGAEGTGFVNGIHAIIADTSKNFANGIKQILQDKNFSRRLVEAAQRLLTTQNHPSGGLALLSQLSGLDRRRSQPTTGGSRTY